MQVALHNKVKTYNLTSGKSLPEWLSERRKNKRNTADGENRIELLHDLEFPHCARCLFRCANGTNLFAAGDYPYRLKCFDVNELSMKYSFNADMNIMSGVSLSADYRKFALRGDGRQITVHHSAAIVDRLRVPHMQRGLGYNPFTAELLSCGVSAEVFRISLETGAFVESYKTASTVGVNHVDVFGNGPASGVAMTAGADGYLEAWDSRAGTSAARIHVLGHSQQSCEIRHVALDDHGSTGLLLSCGLESGEVVLYDIRLQRPLLVKDHMNSLPIVKSYFFQGRSTSTGEASYILSADTRAVKVWNKNDGSNFTSIEAPADITDFCLLRSQHNMTEPYECADSGVLAICCDVPRVQVHFIPQLGAAPRWASFLEVMTEELEEKDATTVYDDYTFLAKEEMDKLGISAEDVAGGKVRPAMHGAFVENALYRELRAVVNPAAFNEYLNDNAKKKKQTRWADRISRFSRPSDDATTEATTSTSRGDALAAAQGDARFAKAIDPATGKAKSSYALDRNNPEYAKLLRTIDSRREAASQRRTKYESELFSVVPGSEEPVAGEDGGEDAKRYLRGVKSSGKVSRPARRTSSAEEGESDAAATSNAPSGGKVQMFEAKTVRSAELFGRSEKAVHAARKKDRAGKLTLEERLKRARHQ